MHGYGSWAVHSSDLLPFSELGAPRRAPLLGSLRGADVELRHEYHCHQHPPVDRDHCTFGGGITTTTTRRSTSHFFFFFFVLEYWRRHGSSRLGSHVLLPKMRIPSFCGTFIWTMWPCNGCGINTRSGVWNDDANPASLRPAPPNYNVSYWISVPTVAIVPPDRPCSSF